MESTSFLKKNKILFAAILSSTATYFVVRKGITSVARKNKKLERLNGLKTEAMAACSHDMKSPVQATMFMLELLMMEQDGKLTEEQKDTLESIRKNEEEIMSLITNLLDLARCEEGTMSLHRDNTDMRALLAGWSERQRAITDRRGLAFRVAIKDGGGSYVYEVDAFKITQVLNDLMSNALKYTPAGGEIVLSVRKKFNGHLRVSLFNSGTAIKNEDLTTIFERYVQASDGQESRSGAGLGLNIAKTIVEMHGGEIWAKNLARKGNVFSFNIPPDGQAGVVVRESTAPVRRLQNAVMALFTSSRGGTTPRHEASGLSSLSTTSMVGVDSTP
jgi:signal transduction histidine kinase